jgi:pheromone a factor receptor
MTQSEYFAATHYQIALNVAIPACSLVISRRLFEIVQGRTVMDSQDSKGKEIIVDLGIGLGVPILSMALSVIPQGHRFDIYEEMGCRPAIYSTIAALLLINAWPLIIGIVSGIYTCLIFYAMAKRNANLKELIASHPNLSVSRYWRLIILASMDIIFTIPLYSYNLYLTTLTLQPWISWDNVHADFGYIGQYPSVLWRQDTQGVITLEYDRWVYVFCAIVAFALFGFGAEARNDYRSIWTSISSRIIPRTAGACKTTSIHPLKAFNTSGRHSELPVFNRQNHSQDPNTSSATISTWPSTIEMSSPMMVH